MLRSAHPMTFSMRETVTIFAGAMRGMPRHTTMDHGQASATGRFHGGFAGTRWPGCIPSGMNGAGIAATAITQDTVISALKGMADGKAEDTEG